MIEQACNHQTLLAAIAIIEAASIAALIIGLTFSPRVKE